MVARSGEGTDIGRVWIVIHPSGGAPPGVKCVRIAPDHVAIATRLSEVECEAARLAIEIGRERVAIPRRIGGGKAFS